MRTEFDGKCMPLLMKSALLLPLWGAEGIRTILLQQRPHHCPALPVWSYCVSTRFAQTTRMPPLFLFVLGLLVRTKMCIKLVGVLFPLMIGIACFLWRANNLMSGEQRSSIPPKNDKQR